MTCLRSVLPNQVNTVGKDKRYQITYLLTQGSTANIYSAFDTKKQRHVIVKVQFDENATSRLLHECNMYCALQKHNNSMVRLISSSSLLGFPWQTTACDAPVPKMHYCATQNTHNVLVMQQLGPSLQQVMQVYPKGRLPLRTVLFLGLQMLHVLEYIHSRCVIHRDVKPANFCLGTGQNSMRVYAIDFGLSKKFIYHDEEHIKWRKVTQLVGCARYASLNAHRLGQQSRRDDLQSLGYVLIDMLVGLPWGQQSDEDKIGELKARTSGQKLCQGVPAVLRIFVQTARGTEFASKPNYQFYSNLLRFQWIKQGFDVNDTPNDLNL